jgi:hypothetical protein
MKVSYPFFILTESLWYDFTGTSIYLLRISVMWIMYIGFMLTMFVLCSYTSGVLQKLEHENTRGISHDAKIMTYLIIIICFCSSIIIILW